MFDKLNTLIRLPLGAALAGALLIAPACGNDNRESDPVIEEPLPSILDETPKTSVVPNDNARRPDPEPVAEPTPVVEPEPERTVAELIRDGKKLSARGDHLDAIELLADAVDREPGSGSARIELARAHLAAGSSRAARPHAERAVELVPESSYAWNTLGRVELMDGDNEAAITSFQRATDENEDNIYAWNNLGLTYIKQQQWESAIEALEVATSASKPKAYMWNNLAGAYEKLGRTDEARAAYRQAAGLGSELARTSLERLSGDLDLVGQELFDEDVD